MEVERNDPRVELQPSVSGQVAPIQAEHQPRPPGQKRFQFLRMLLANRKAMLGVIILGIFILLAILAPVIKPGDPNAFVDLQHLPPSGSHWLGTTWAGQDVLAQLLWGARVSLSVAAIVGALTTIVSLIVGMSAAYFGGRVDDLLMLLANIFLIIPGLPLIVILAAFLSPGTLTIIGVLTLTGWAWGARVLRSQTMSLRNQDFVAAALVSGESSPRIIFREILPNMYSIVVANFIGATIYTIGAEAALEFLGLGNSNTVSWGTILYWAQNQGDLLQGTWWTFIPAGLAIALVAFALAMLNYAMDEVTNPRLRAVKETTNVLKKYSIRAARATPVLRRARQSAPARGS